MNRKEGAGFLGCVRLPPAVISRLKDTGCEFMNVHDKKEQYACTGFELQMRAFNQPQGLFGGGQKPPPLETGLPPPPF